jgi:hypothetical protein
LLSEALCTSWTPEDDIVHGGSGVQSQKEWEVGADLQGGEYVALLASCNGILFYDVLKTPFCMERWVRVPWNGYLDPPLAGAWNYGIAVKLLHALCEHRAESRNLGELRVVITGRARLSAWALADIVLRDKLLRQCPSGFSCPKQEVHFDTLPQSGLAQKK